MVKLKPIWTVLKLLLLIVLVLFIFAAIWLRQGPKSLNWAKPLVLNRLNSVDNPYVIAVGDLAIDWRDLSRFGLVSVRDVKLSARDDGAVFASLPEMFVSLDPTGFMPGRRVLNSIYLQQPRILLTRDKEKRLRLGLQGGDQPAAPLAELDNADDGDKRGWSGKLPFRNLRVDEPYLLISDEVTGKTLVSEGGAIRLGRRFGHYHGGIDLPFTYGKQHGAIKGKIHTVEQGQHLLDLTLAQLPTDYTCILADCPEGMEISGVVEGEVTLAFDDRLALHGGHAALTTEAFTLVAPEWFPEPLRMKQSSIDFRADEGLENIEVSKIELDLEHTFLTGKAMIEKRPDGWYAQGEGNVDKLNIRKLYKYWPLTLAPDSRTWVTDSLTEGFGENGRIVFSMTPKDFASENISDKAIAAEVMARGMTVHYIAGFPEMRNVNGLVKFTGTTIDINADSGSMLTGTTIGKAHIAFPDLNKPATPMVISTQLNAPAADAATLLALEHFTFDDALELNPKTIRGTVDGTLKLTFDAFSEDAPDAPPKGDEQVNFDAVAYEVDLNVKDISQPDFAGAVDIAGAHGKLAANNNGMSFEGGVKLGPASDIKVKVGQKSGQDVTLLLDGGITREEFAALGLPDDSRFGEGSLKLLADVTVLKDDILLKEGSVDLTDMAFNLPEISWQKRRGAPALVKLTPKGKSYGLDIKAPGLSAPNATLALDNDMNLKELVLPRIRAGESDFGLRYRNTADGHDASLTGNTLDASMSYLGEGSGGENNLLADFPALKLKLDLGALILVPQHPLTQVKGALECTHERCISADISAQTGSGMLRATIGYVQGKRQFLMTASDAGAMLRTFDITDRMYGGRFELKGTYDDSVTPPALPAKLTIRRFTLRNSEILGRILSIGSLTGLSNALTGSGIAFQKLEGDIYSQGGVIKITDAKASGNALGMSIAGTVNTQKSTLSLKGTLVPAAAINTIFSNIPLLGKIAGGDEGLIAFNFSVKGPYASPSVSVNPFSGLTPGFLRGIWGSNEPSDEETAKPSEQAPARRHQRGIGY